MAEAALRDVAAKQGWALPKSPSVPKAFSALNSSISSKTKKEDSENNGTPVSQVTELSLQRRMLTSLLTGTGSGSSSAFLSAGFYNIVSLDLARNSLSCLAGLEQLSKLESLVLYMNRISDGRELLRLRTNERLRRLDTRLNIVGKARWYRPFVLQNLPSLQTLDEQGVLAYERRKAGEIPAISHSDLSYRGEDSDSEDNDEVNDPPQEYYEKRETDALQVEFLSASKGVDSESDKDEDEGDNVEETVKFAGESPEVRLAHELNEELCSNLGESDNLGEDEEREEEEDTSDCDDDIDAENYSNKLDHSLLQVLKYVRERMASQSVGRGEWESVMGGLNDRLVGVVNSRKKEKGEQNAAQAHTQQLASMNTKLQVSLQDSAMERDSLVEELRQMKKEIQTTKEQMQSVKERQQEAAKQRENNVHAKVHAMLLETHNALISTNRSLLQELEETKARYRADEAQWNRNFERLRLMKQETNRVLNDNE